ncbi:MAG: DUF819 family protein [Eubacteriales bacterium]
MITSGFTYFAVLVALAATLVGLEKTTGSKLFKFAPPIVLMYLLCMVLCTMNLWDLAETSAAYGNTRNNILYGMIFLMMIRCDVRKIVKLGPKMIGGFLAASLSIGLGFIITYALFSSALGADAWKALAALCGSWMGGSGNMMAIQAALDISEGDMVYALVIDSIDYSIWVMFLLWVINFAPQFNKWSKADTSVLDEVCARLEAESADEKASPITFESLFALFGMALLASALCQNVGTYLQATVGIMDKATWIVVVITVLGLGCAVTPIGKIAGASELSSMFLYTVVGLLASRATLAELSDAPLWIAAGFVILAIHAGIMIVLAKIFKLDMFTCGVASLANIGGTASAPILAGSYSPALVPVGVLMALIGYVVGTGGGLLVANIMKMFA